MLKIFLLIMLKTTTLWFQPYSILQWFADCLNVQIICSFNTDILKIGSALLRKGMLIAMYEFKELESEKAQRLSNNLGYHTLINEPMTLTSIYNQNEKDF